MEKGQRLRRYITSGYAFTQYFSTAAARYFLSASTTSPGRTQSCHHAFILPIDAVDSTTVAAAVVVVIVVVVGIVLTFVVVGIVLAFVVVAVVIVVMVVVAAVGSSYRAEAIDEATADESP